MQAICDATIDDDGIHLEPYDFPGSAFHPAGLCRWQDVREIYPKVAPPEVRTAREIVFVPAPRRAELERAAAARGIACVMRFDVWGLILEPFLDTSFKAADCERTYRNLERAGVPRATCDALRRELGPAMKAYNFDSMLWDWASLSLYDALCALRGVLSGPRFRLPDREFATFYRRAMALALAAPVVAPRPE
jgi:hypothetical protein